MTCCEWSEGYTEDAKDVCQSCENREFRLLYDSCPDGRCKGPRDCARHKHLWDRPEGWPTSYPPPENAGDASRIAPSHRYNARGTKAERDQRRAEKAKIKQEESPQQITKRWEGYSNRLDALISAHLAPRPAKETRQQKEVRFAAAEDAACDAMARRIEARRIEEWRQEDDTESQVESYKNLAVGESISNVMGLLAG